jgi:hypothetical protein
VRRTHSVRRPTSARSRRCPQRRHELEIAAHALATAFKVNNRPLALPEARRPQPATGRARLSDTRPREWPSLFRRISAANAAQCASIEAKMPKCRRKNRQGDIRH